MVTLYVKAEGQDTVMNVIASMAARGVNTRPLMGQIGEIIRGSVTRNFESEGRPEKWKPISELTKKIYDASVLEQLHGSKGYQRIKKAETRKKWEETALGQQSNKILHREGDLKKSIDIGKITNTSVEIGSSLPYARIHQLGGEIKPKNKRALLIPVGGRFLMVKKVTIPARPYLVLQEEDNTAILRVTKDYIMEAANNVR
ncbi:phage virion morphogenesis protein [Pelotomaculum propionicicum]|uniref:Phage virion morphogenesis protein n=1 Tax=Pelotomaculum propionicicum TaxID=258475 RepID=A0A4Y7RLY1_9FIRM|nr:phage virion morphogenesis protein [Pelotomaculum propionicicum]TEB09307.1 hypothetical protein Pmgp_03239 [Pelotomaculum propionicicum]